MKKFRILLCSLLLTLFFMFGCSFNPVQKHNLSKSLIKERVDLSYEYSDERDEHYGDFIDNINAFQNTLSSYVLKDNLDNTNQVISPSNIFMCLAQALECGSNEAREELLNAFNVDYELLNNCINTYLKGFSSYNQKGTSLKMSNSIWIDKTLSVEDNCINNLANRFNTSSYYVDYKDIKNVKHLMSYYIKQETNNHLNTVPNIDANTLMTLMSVLYLKDLWNFYGDDLKVLGQYDFTSYDNEVKKLDYFTNGYLSGKVYDGPTYKAFHTKLLRTYITFYLPKDGYEINDLLENNVLNDDINYVYVDDSIKTMYESRVIFPEFSCKSNVSVKDILTTKFKINKIFDDYAFTNLSKDNLLAIDVFHAAKLDLTKKGIEGSAVTYIPAPGAVGPGDYIYVYEDLILDKPFIFKVTFIEKNYDVNLFAGFVNKL